MGFKAPKTVFRLSFEDEAYAGLEVMVASTTIGRVMEIENRMAEIRAGGNGAGMTGYQAQMFAEALVSWNLEDDNGEPIPATLEGVQSLEPGFLLVLITTWSQAIAAVDAPLPAGSPSGATSPVSLIPMEPLPTSRAS